MRVKLIIFLSLLVQLFYLEGFVYAQKNTATSSADEEIESFKNKIASKVAELTKKDEKAVSGFVVKIDKNQLMINTEDQPNFSVKIDNILTKIFQIIGNQKKEIRLNDIEKNDYLIISGPSSDTSITANYIFVDEKYLINSGKITEVDEENYTLRVSTLDKEVITLDVETNTKRLMMDIKTLALIPIGFSKIKEGDTIHFIVKITEPEKKATRFSAIKLIIIPQEYFIK